MKEEEGERQKRQKGNREVDDMFDSLLTTVCVYNHQIVVHL